MKHIDIIGKNYFGHYEHVREGSRCIIVKDDKILLSYYTNLELYMIPGGGKEERESDAECCIREIEEETGLIVEVGEPIIEINEYYEDWRYVDKYFIGRIVGEGKIKLTSAEIESGEMPRWLPLHKVLKMFGSYHQFAETDEIRHGIYYREYTALFNCLRHLKTE